MCSLKDFLPQLLKCCWQTIEWSTILVYLVFFSANIRTVLIWAGWSPFEIVFIRIFRDYLSCRELPIVRSCPFSAWLTSNDLLYEGVWQAWHLSPSSCTVSLWGRLRLSLTRITARPPPPFHVFGSQGCFLINILDAEVNLKVCFWGNLKHTVVHALGFQQKSTWVY